MLQSHNNFNVPQPAQLTAATGAMTIGNLVRATNLDTTVSFTGGTGGFFANQPGLNQTNLFINSIDGVAIPATIPGKILGGWALVSNGEFASYISPTTTGANNLNYGVVTMNANLPGIAQSNYDATALTAAGTATTNVRLGGNSALIAGGTTYNSLAVRAASAITFAAAGDVLNLASGGFALRAARRRRWERWRFLASSLPAARPRG